MSKDFLMLRVDKRLLNIIQHALSTASHHFNQCAMIDAARVRPADRLAQIKEYEKVFQRLLEVEFRSGWRKRPESGSVAQRRTTKA